jgi:hypothetical protein
LILETLGLAVGANVGVVPGILNELAVTSTGDNNITIATGRALVQGKIYESDAEESKTTNDPGGAATTGRRCVLRRDWSARTVRITIISSADDVSALPALTQVDGVTWEIPLASFQIAPSGAITALASEREWASPDRIITVRKAAITTINNDDSLNDDPDFAFSIGANEVWIVEIHAIVAIAIASDFKFTFTLPASATMMALANMWGLTNDVGGAGKGTTPGTAIPLTSTTNIGQLHVWALLANAGTAGTATFQWAQNTAVAEDTSIDADSVMVARRIA